ncbi:hypothetical protein [Haloimpatiens lingqiaonensis]|uniref:hypothetical protein n=1 Tax=Haloimpatiens lingqiaonensis TaxID=1380675 RepID=UPI0010FF449A|nr:hypothetical protein [Haloimpatiens lingqiaonensis]
MKSKLLCTLGFLFIMFSLVGCGVSNPSQTTTNKVAKLTNADQLPAVNTQYEYYGDNIPPTKDFNKDNNYDTITKLVDNFNKAWFEVDYTKEDTYFDYRNYLTNFQLEKEKKKDDKKSIDNIITKKLQRDYIKTNIDSITYNDYSKVYIAECSAYTLEKNNPSVSKQNKYYQNKIFLFILLENNKWVVDTETHFSPVPAEQVPTRPITYMFDNNKDTDVYDSIYLKDNELYKMKELQNIKDELKLYSEAYYTLDYKNTDNYNNTVLNFITNNYKENIKGSTDNIIKQVKDNKIELKFKAIDYKFFNYVNTNNSYWVVYNVIFYNNGNTLQTPPITARIVKEDNKWKIDSLKYTGNISIINKGN